MKMNYEKVLNILKRENKKYHQPLVSNMTAKKATPFQILIGTILSARTKDTLTEKITPILFGKLSDATQMSKAEIKKIERLIYPLGFYKTKAKHLKQTSKIILDRYNGKVPDTREELVKLPGVGRKTANLVLAKVFRKPAICVDVHVHKISNRLGWVRTKTPEQTEKRLMEILPKKHWKRINDLFVVHGQNICFTRNPKCEGCKIRRYCDYFKSI